MLTTNQLYKLLDENEVLIYGAGYVAQRLYKALSNLNKAENIESFVTTHGDKRGLYGLPVLSINEILGNDKEKLILVAVHESVKDEIIKTLEEKNITNYIWVTPILYDILLGEPIAQNVEITLKEIWEANKENFGMAIRYLVLDQYYGKCNDGYDIYLSCIKLYSDEDTARKRLKQFLSMIIGWEINGYDKNRPVSLLENNTYVDGGHRISVASYKKQEIIMCNIYRGLKSVHNEKVLLTKNTAEKLGVERWMIDRLLETNRRIASQYQ